MNRDNWTDMATFAAIADAGSFTRAAAGLGVSPSALSHAMRGLETRLGVRLLNRTTRSVAPTEAGERLLERLRPAIGELDELLGRLDAERDRPAGRLRISAHRTAAVHLIVPLLPRFCADHPEVQVELAIEDGLVDIVAAGFDLGVRHEHVLDLDMISVRVGDTLRTVIVGAPDYLARADVPRAPEDLLGHRCLLYRYTSSGQIHRWRFERDGREVAIAPPPSFVSNDVDLLRDAALGGLGLACLSEPQARAALADGTLVELLADWSVPIPPNYLYYPGRRQMRPALRAFIDALVADQR